MRKQPGGAIRQSLLFFILVVIGIGAGVWWQQRTKNQGVPPELQSVLHESRTLQPFKLTDHDERPFDLARLNGKWSFLFFGYTHCPDVCPFTLAEMDRVYQRLAQTPHGLDQTQFVFVSVDPKRDRPGSLKDYVTYFNASFLAATGTREGIDGLTQQMGVHYKYVTGFTPEEYLVNHSASVFLVDPDGRWLATFKPPHEAEAISDQFLKIRSAASS